MLEIDVLCMRIRKINNITKLHSRYYSHLITPPKYTKSSDYRNRLEIASNFVKSVPFACVFSLRIVRRMVGIGT